MTDRCNSKPISGPADPNTKPGSEEVVKSLKLTLSSAHWQLLVAEADERQLSLNQLISQLLRGACQNSFGHRELSSDEVRVVLEKAAALDEALKAWELSGKMA